MNKINFLLAAAAFAVAIPAAAQNVDPAPSGTELSHVSTGSNGVSVETPGKDAPTSSTRDGNVEKIDFDPAGRTGTADADDTTVEHDPDSE